MNYFFFLFLQILPFLSLLFILCVVTLALFLVFKESLQTFRLQQAFRALVRGFSSQRALFLLWRSQQWTKQTFTPTQTQKWKALVKTALSKEDQLLLKLSAQRCLRVSKLSKVDPTSQYAVLTTWLWCEDSSLLQQLSLF